MAMKATNIVRSTSEGNLSEAIFKDPKTNTGGFSKKSAKGYLKVNQKNDGTIVATDNLPSLADSFDGLLTKIYLDGEITRYEKLATIRERINKLIK